MVNALDEYTKLLSVVDDVRRQAPGMPQLLPSQ